MASGWASDPLAVRKGLMGRRADAGPVPRSLRQGRRRPRSQEPAFCHEPAHPASRGSAVWRRVLAAIVLNCPLV